jgi:hypothetical protein
MACSNDIYSIVPSVYALYIRDTNSYNIVGSLLGYLYFNLYATGWNSICVSIQPWIRCRLAKRVRLESCEDLTSSTSCNSTNYDGRAFISRLARVSLSSLHSVAKERGIFTNLFLRAYTTLQKTTTIPNHVLPSHTTPEAQSKSCDLYGP